MAANNNNTSVRQFKPFEYNIKMHKNNLTIHLKDVNEFTRYLATWHTLHAQIGNSSSVPFTIYHVYKLFEAQIIYK